MLKCPNVQLFVWITVLNHFHLSNVSTGAALSYCLSETSCFSSSSFMSFFWLAAPRKAEGSNSRWAGLPRSQPDLHTSDDIIKDLCSLSYIEPKAEKAMLGPLSLWFIAIISTYADKRGGKDTMNNSNGSFCLILCQLFEALTLVCCTLFGGIQKN